MRLKSMIGIVVSLASLGAAFAAPAFNSHEVAINCSAPNGSNVSICDYRHSPNASIQGISLVVDGDPRKVSDTQPFVKTSKTAAILFVIDTSDPRRGNTVIRNIDAVREMVAHLRPQDKVGLAVFDQGLHLIAPLGSSRNEFAAALGQVKASGLSTQLYKTVIQGVATLKAYPANRKGLVIMSDGKAEDPHNGYGVAEAVAAAKDAEVSILALGYAERPQDAASLETIERLAQDTNGQFYSIPAGQPLPPRLSASPAAFIETGGQFKFQTGDVYGTKTLTLNLKDAEGRVISGKQTLNFNAGRGFIANAKALFAEHTYWVLIALLGILAAVAGFIVFLRRPRPIDSQVIFGWIDDLGADGSRYLLKGSSIRIGRGPENDIRFGNSSISTNHATIVRRSNSAQIIDLESTNGVMVNDVPTKQAMLHSGDLIELGEVRLRYTENSDL